MRNASPLRLFVLATLIVASGCQDSSAPSAPAETPVRTTINPLRWRSAPMPAPRLRVSSSSPVVAVVPGVAAVSPIGGPEPSPATVTFWAYTNQASSAEVDYLAADSSWQPYVTLSIPAGALRRRPDGSSFAAVDSIQVSISVDSTQILVDLEPTGLTFNLFVPATLKIWYAGANQDFNGDGVVNVFDSILERALSLWVQDDPLDPWSLVSAVQNLFDKTFTARLRHFSGYAVSW